MTDFALNPDRSGLEPELGGIFRDAPDRSGLEPELGGQLRQKGVYVDELTCIGCKHCAHVSPNIFYIEENNGRARVYNQDGDEEDTIQEVRTTQRIKPLGFPLVHRSSKRKRKRPKTI